MIPTIDGAVVETQEGAELGRVVRHDASVIEVRARDGRVWRLPPGALTRVDDRADRLRMVHPLSDTSGPMATEEVRIPIAAEEVRIDRRVVEGEHVRITVRTTEEERTVPAVELGREVLEIDRVRHDREIAAPPPVREEGDVTVVSVVEEVLVVRKALVLREEIRIRRRRVVDAHPAQKVTVRAEHAEIERLSHP